MRHRQFGGLATGAAIAVMASLLVPACSARSAESAAAPEVRVNQVGYASQSPKVAFAMLPRRVRSVSFTISGRQGVVFRGRSSQEVGSWNSRYRAVYQLGFAALSRPGSYRIRIDAAGVTALSPRFAIASPGGLYRGLVLNAVRYFTSVRDGAGVLGSVLSRQPANLTDSRAYVYQAPP
jgi:endoglucanase